VAVGLVLVAFSVLVRVAMLLLGLIRRLGVLLAGGIVAVGSIPGTSRPGCWGLAARRVAACSRPDATTTALLVSACSTIRAKAMPVMAPSSAP
jgi:hypothetical protein